MKIVYYSAPPYTDLDFPLIREFQRQGHEIHYFIELAPYSLKAPLFNIKTMQKKTNIINATDYDEIKAFSGYMNLQNVHIINRTDSNEYTLKSILLRIKFIKLLYKINPEILHCNTIPSHTNLLLYLFRKRIVQSVHDPFLHSSEYSSSKEFFRKISFRFSQKLVLLNLSQLHSFISTYNVNPSKVSINKLGCADCVCYFNSGLNYQIPDNYILSFGRISKYKGLEYLCEAMKIVRKKDPNIKCIIAGGGKMYFDINPYQDSNVIFINRYISMQELSALIRNARFVVCPYVDATQSGVIQTSFAMCKPVIATNVGGLPEHVIDGQTGYLVPPKDSDKLAEAIIRSNKENKDKILEDNIRERNNSIYNWEQIAKKYIEIYREV